MVGITTKYSFIKKNYILHALLSLFGLPVSIAIASTSQKNGENSSGNVIVPKQNGKHCIGTSEKKVVWRHMLGVKAPSWGGQHRGRLGYCIPIFKKPGVLFERSYFEIGMQHRIGPAYGMLGAYIDVAPLSLLVFRVGIDKVAYWPIPVKQTGYHSRSGYNESLNKDSFPIEDAMSAIGFRAYNLVMLRLKVPIGQFNIYWVNRAFFEYWKLGHAGYFYNVEKALIMKNGDLLIQNEALVLLGIPVHKSLELQIGGFDRLNSVPASGICTNQVGPMMAAKKHNGYIVFARGSFYTKHPARRGEFNIIVGFAIEFELSGDK